MSIPRKSRPEEGVPPAPTPAEFRAIEQLRPHRQVYDRANGLGDQFQTLARDYQRAGKRLDGLGEVWDALCPPGLIQRTALRPIKRGVLTIAVSDSTTRYAVEKAVKAGLDRELIMAAPMTVRSVKVVLAREA